MSTLPPEADMLIVGINVCYVPIADVEKAPETPTVIDVPQPQTSDVDRCSASLRDLYVAGGDLAFVGGEGGQDFGLLRFLDLEEI